MIGSFLGVGRVDDSNIKTVPPGRSRASDIPAQPPPRMARDFCSAAGIRQSFKTDMQAVIMLRQAVTAAIDQRCSDQACPRLGQHCRDNTPPIPGMVTGAEFDADLAIDACGHQNGQMRPQRQIVEPRFRLHNTVRQG